MKTYLGISRDHSASMRSIAKSAARDYNQLIASAKSNSATENIDTMVSVVKCGSGYSGRVEIEFKNCLVQDVPVISELRYDANGGSTPLFDSIGQLIEQLESVPDAKDPEVNFLIMAVTDGEDNSSERWENKLVDKIRQLQATDHWTFVFRVPRGYAKELNAMGIPIGNILEWDQTERGVEEATKKTDVAMRTFYVNKSAGTQSTSEFYSTNLSGVSSAKIKSALVDISSEVKFWNVNAYDEDIGIRDFCEGYLTSPMKRGAAFYQLMKSEKKVQDYKVICIRDKKTKSVYTGAAARDLLGLPYNGTVKIVPGNHGSYDIFIQSTSVNRKLVSGTQVMYWDKVGTDYQSSTTPVTAVKRAPVTQNPAPVQSPQPVSVQSPVHSDQYIGGYKQGFVSGKTNTFKLALDKSVFEFDKGYIAGYKDGRGKKKRLYK